MLIMFTVAGRFRSLVTNLVQQCCLQLAECFLTRSFVTDAFGRHVANMVGLLICQFFYK